MINIIRKVFGFILINGKDLSTKNTFLKCESDFLSRNTYTKSVHQTQCKGHSSLFSILITSHPLQRESFISDLNALAKLAFAILKIR